MDDSTEKDCCCCSCSHCCTFCLGRERQSKKFAQIKYKMIPPSLPGLHKSFVHPQGHSQVSPAVIVPRDMEHYLQRSPSNQSHLQSPVVKQQPTCLSTPPYGLSRVASSRKDHDSSYSSSEGSPAPTITRLRSGLLTPQEKKGEDTIDVSQSPTGTFSSAYRRSQKRPSYPSGRHSTTTSSRHSTMQESSSDEKEETTSQKSVFGDSEQSPNIQLSMYYSVETECLSVCFHSAHNLPLKTSRHYSFVLHLVPEQTETQEMKIAGDDRNPSLEQCFDFRNIARDKIRQLNLVVNLYDGGLGTGELLGHTKIELNQTDLFGMICSVTIVTDTNRPQEELLLSLAYNTTTSTLQGIILKLTNSTTANDKDVYVKVYLAYRGKRTKYWRSLNKQSSLSLIFNEPFQFDLGQKNIHHTSLEIFVMRHDRHTKDEEIGHVTIGDTARQETGRQHWNQIITQPQARVSHWHSFTLSDNSKK